MNMNHNHNENPFDGSPLHDALRDWHKQNADEAQSARDALVERLARESDETSPIGSIGVSVEEKVSLAAEPTRKGGWWKQAVLPLAASLALVGGLAVWFGGDFVRNPEQSDSGAITFKTPAGSGEQLAQGGDLEIGEPARAQSSEQGEARGKFVPAAFTPVAGRLAAQNDAGEDLGLCPLEHTAVDVRIAGRFAHVSLEQDYYNAFADKIEAVYTFPMSQDAAVHAMRISVGDRVIEGEIEERERARQIYEAARARGNVAGLLEQERPNIFTQSVANIEAGAKVTVRIEYIEMVTESEGERSFDFPMVVGPRFIPGGAPPPLGADAPVAAEPGGAFADPTRRVPDADRITPMPNLPDERAGHDISLSVSIDTGGPALLGFESETHDITINSERVNEEGARTGASITLKSVTTIPNKDFVLSWAQESGFIEPAVFTQRDDRGAFATLVLEPPARVSPATAAPKELVFVLDVSGSMNGQPIEKAKQVINESLAMLRPQDTFNIVTFAGDTRVLWDAPRPGDPDNIGEARAFVNEQRGAGGTHMMHAINKALIQEEADLPKPVSLEELAQLPADGRSVVVLAGHMMVDDHLRGIEPEGTNILLPLRNGRHIEATPWDAKIQPGIMCPVGAPLYLTGRWITEDGRRLLEVDSASYGEPIKPLRIVVFLTDGMVGDEAEIISAVQRNSATTRVFSFGVGASPNRYLLDSMARASKGEVEYVGLSADAEEKATRFARRISTPVLRDITLTVPASLAEADISSPDLLAHPVLLDKRRNGDAVYSLPDLFDVRPITVHLRLDRPAEGEVVFRGGSPIGVYERALAVTFEEASESELLPVLWARAKIGHLMHSEPEANRRGEVPADVREEIVGIGKTYSIMSRFTSFVAVDRARVTVGGEPRMVRVPIEMPEGMNYWSAFSQLPRETQEWLRPSMAQNVQVDPMATPTQDDETSLGGSAPSIAQTDLRWPDRLVGHDPSVLLSVPDAQRVGGAPQPETAIATRRFLDMSGERRGMTGEEFAELTEEAPQRLLLNIPDSAEVGTDSGEKSADGALSEEHYPAHRRVRLFVTKLETDLLNLLAGGKLIGQVRVSILVERLDDASLGKLREAGATIRGTNRGMSLVIADTDAGGLQALVELDEVERIERLDERPDA